MSVITARPLTARPLTAVPLTARSLGVNPVASTVIFNAPLLSSLTPSFAVGSSTPTFTRGSNGTYVDASGIVQTASSNVARFAGGTIGFLCEGSRENKCLRSGDMSHSTWAATNCTKTGSAATSPSGASDAASLVPNTTSGQHRIDQTTTIAAGSTTFSVYVKPNGYNYVWLRIGTAISASFDCTTGEASSVLGGTTTKSTSIGNGWWRVSISGTALGSDTMRVNVTTTTSQADYAGNGTSGVYVWGAQVEAGSLPSSYIATTTVAVTRSADADSYVVSGNVATAESTISLEWTPPFSGMDTVTLWGSYVDASNYTSIFHDGTNIVFRRRISGVNYDATKALSYTAATAYKIAARLSGVTGGDVFVAGVKGTNTANTSAQQLGANFSVGMDGNSASHCFASIRNLKHQGVALTDGQVAAL